MCHIPVESHAVFLASLAYRLTSILWGQELVCSLFLPTRPKLLTAIVYMFLSGSMSSCILVSTVRSNCINALSGKRPTGISRLTFLRTLSAFVFSLYPPLPQVPTSPLCFVAGRPSEVALRERPPPSCFLIFSE